MVVAADIARVRRRLRRARLRLRPRPGSSRSSSCASRASAGRRRRRRRSSCAQAIEPWNVLGEEVGAAAPRATSTSSVERLQVRVDGLDRRTPRRACNGVGCRCSRHRRRRARASPASASARGSRRRRCTRRSACTRRCRSTSSTLERPVARRLHATRRPPRRARPTSRCPVNAAEAEARRGARFEPIGHTTGRSHAAAGPPLRRIPSHARSAARPGYRRGQRHVTNLTARHRPFTPRATAAARAAGTRCSTTPERSAASGRSCRGAGRARRRRAARRQQEAARLLEQDGVIYNVYGDDARASPPLAAGSGADADRQPRVGGDRDGVIERAELLEPGARGPLRSARAAAPRPAAGRARVRPRRLPARVRRDPPARRPAAVHLRRRPRPRRRRPAGSCWPTAPRRRRAPATRWRTARSSRGCSRACYRDAQVHRLAPFFRALRRRRCRSRARGVEDPRIVVLTPGPVERDRVRARGAGARRSATRWSRARDLVVRGDGVWMRSLGRLEPVDVILRRVDAGWCDPLELRARLAARRARPGRGGPRAAPSRSSTRSARACSRARR